MKEIDYKQIPNSDLTIKMTIGNDFSVYDITPEILMEIKNNLDSEFKMNLDFNTYNDPIQIFNQKLGLHFNINRNGSLGFICKNLHSDQILNKLKQLLKACQPIIKEKKGISYYILIEKPYTQYDPSLNQLFNIQVRIKDDMESLNKETLDANPCFFTFRFEDEKQTYKIEINKVFNEQTHQFILKYFIHVSDPETIFNPININEHFHKTITIFNEGITQKGLDFFGIGIEDPDIFEDFEEEPEEWD